MKIAQSQVNMGTARQYVQMGNPSGKNRSGGFMEYVSEASESRYDYQKGTDSDRLSGGVDNESEQNPSVGLTNTIMGLNSAQTSSSIPTDLQFSLLNLLMRRLFSVYMQSMGNGATQRIVNYAEYEDTTFYAQGQAITEDGRQIDFNVDIMMSRSYMEYTDIPMVQLGGALCDPLVINIDSTLSQISDQKFKFDLDADGVEDDISMLGKGSGFLALDRNGDGIINDGSELFGTKSGDGFADLREYDSDGNGWIDENDEIFDKLKVWCKNDCGEDILMDLKQADIGAIFLGAESTEFSMYGMNGGLNGVVRSTGFFLKESGGASTVQHIDLATESSEDSRRADYLAKEASGEAGYLGGAGGALTISGIGTTSNSGAMSDRNRRQQIMNNRIAKEREERNYRNRMARNKRIREERLQRQQDRRREQMKFEEEQIAERRLERKDFNEEQIAKLLEDRSFDTIGGGFYTDSRLVGVGQLF